MQRYEHFLSRKLTRAAYKAKILQNVNCTFKIRNRGIFISLLGKKDSIRIRRSFNKKFTPTKIVANFIYTKRRRRRRKDLIRRNKSYSTFQLTESTWQLSKYVSWPVIYGRDIRANSKTKIESKDSRYLYNRERNRSSSRINYLRNNDIPSLPSPSNSPRS